MLFNIFLFLFSIIIFISIFLSLKNTNKIEQFTDKIQEANDAYQTSNNRCAFLADVGMVCALNVSNNKYIIKPYQEVSEHIKKETIDHLIKEWNFYSDYYIKQNWNDAGVFYVMTTPDEKHFIGSVALDRKNFFPTISQLYVIPLERNKAYAKKLLKFAEAYTIKLGFHVARLWCSSELITFYEKMDWHIIEKKNNQYIMEKQLTD